ncbi:MAG TPA: DUF2946 family protein [Telluria sp.]|nr:DUF2946 family protein [Telluria sp.]
MTFAQHARRQTAWIAILAVLLASLLPYVQLAQRAGADGFPLAQICTAGGAKLLPSGAPGVPATDHHAQHCSLCWTPGGAGLPPSGPLVLAAAGLHRAAAAPAAPAPATAAAWSPAQPRAPPALPFSAA